MRILFISASPIRKEISIGNTFLNLFEDMEDVELASICARGGAPDPAVSRCWCTTERMQIKNLLRGTPAGRSVEPGESGMAVPAAPGSAVKFVKRHRWTVFFWAQDLIWKLGRWKSPELKRFVEDYDPDVIFTVLSNSVYLNDLILHTLSLSKARLVLYAWDNNYSARQLFLSPLRWIKHFIDRASMRKVAGRADRMYVISRIQKEDYEKCFRKECSVLTKGADFTPPPGVKMQPNDPLQLVFTGNIGLNRWKSLRLIADALESINSGGVRARLRIYTATPLTRGMSEALNRGESSRVMGSVPAGEVPRLQEEADLLVHVEALDLKNRLTVRQSFSTKLVDYLKAARPILAVGPKDVASIDHLIRNDCAVTASDRKELEEKLRQILEDPGILEATARRGYACGRAHHDKARILGTLRGDLEALCPDRMAVNKTGDGSVRPD